MKKVNGKVVRISSVIVVVAFVFGIILPHIKESKVKAEYEASVQTLRKTPAAEYCQNNGGTLEMKLDELNDVYGMCNFEDGSSCEIFEYFRGECLSISEQQDETENCGDLGVCESEDAENLSSWIENINNIEYEDEEILSSDDVDDFDIDSLYDYYENEFNGVGTGNDEQIMGDLNMSDNSEDLLFSKCEGVQGSIIDGKCFLSNGVEIAF